MKKKEIIALRKNVLQTSRSVLARLLKVSEKTVRNWEIGLSRPNKYNKHLLYRLLLVSRSLPKMERGVIVKWFERPFAGHGMRPIDCLGHDRDFDKLKAELEYDGIVI